MARYTQDARGRWHDSETGAFVPEVRRDPSLSSGWRHVTGRPARRGEIIRALKRDIRPDPDSPSGYRRGDGRFPSAKEIEVRRETPPEPPPPRVLPPAEPFTPEPEPIEPEVEWQYDPDVWEHVILFPGWDQVEGVLGTDFEGLLQSIRRIRERRLAWTMDLELLIPRPSVADRDVRIPVEVRGSVDFPAFRQEVVDVFLSGIYREMDVLYEYAKDMGIYHLLLLPGAIWIFTNITLSAE